VLAQYNVVPPLEMTPNDFEVIREGEEFLTEVGHLHWDED
jgi:hypothetical protein